MKDIDRIAAEAAKRFCGFIERLSTLDGLRTATDREFVTNRFRAAIEKATEAKQLVLYKYTLGPDCDSGCLDQGVRVCEHDEIKERQIRNEMIAKRGSPEWRKGAAHASEPWTVKYDPNKILLPVIMQGDKGIACIEGDEADRIADEIADAHNATLPQSAHASEQDTKQELQFLHDEIRDLRGQLGSQTDTVRLDFWFSKGYPAFYSSREELDEAMQNEKTWPWSKDPHSPLNKSRAAHASGMGEGANRSQRLRAHIPEHAAHASEIAGEAAERLRLKIPETLGIALLRAPEIDREHAKSIIKSAIEKATEQQVKNLENCAVIITDLKRQIASRAAHASEPWTVNTILQICDNAGVMLPTDDEAKAIADAHNATLQTAHASELDPNTLDLANRFAQALTEKLDDVLSQTKEKE